MRESLGVNATDAGPACRRLVQAIDMDLPQLVSRLSRPPGMRSIMMIGLVRWPMR